MSFWQSSLGEITGSREDAFSKSFKRIPDETTAVARIESITNKEYDGKKYLQVDWVITDGEFKSQHVFQKLDVYSNEPKKKHRSLNIFRLMYGLFQLNPTIDAPPTDEDLIKFKNKYAGIKIKETAPNIEGKQYNYISEIWPAANFQCKTGVPLANELTEKLLSESALSRNNAYRNEKNNLDEDLLF